MGAVPFLRGVFVANATIVTRLLTKIIVSSDGQTTRTQGARGKSRHCIVTAFPDGKIYMQLQSLPAAEKSNEPVLLIIVETLASPRLSLTQESSELYVHTLLS